MGSLRTQISVFRLGLLVAAAVLSAPPAADAQTTYVGPGSMGAFTAHAVHPSDSDFMLAGADVGGVYLSEDGGDSWTNVTLDLPVQGVFSIDFSIKDEEGVPTTVVFLGTESGVYYSNGFSVSTSSPITGWTDAGLLDGMSMSFAREVLQDLNGETTYLAPVGVVKVDPNNADTIWVGISQLGNFDMAVDSDSPYQEQRFDTWKVYRTTDRGLTWEGMLRFSPRVNGGDFSSARSDYDGQDSDGNVFGILVTPNMSGQVWISSDRGLYKSIPGLDPETSELDWLEIGTMDRRVTHDKGESWTPLSPLCADYSSSTTTLGSWCLPTVSTATIRYVIDADSGSSTFGEVSDYSGTPLSGVSHAESHPNLRALGATTVFTGSGSETTANLRLYVGAWDLGHAGGAPSACSSSSIFDDSALEYFRGGIYASDDLGETWTWLLTDNGAPPPTGTSIFGDGSEDVHYRCDEDASVRASSNGFTACGALSAAGSYYDSSPPTSGPVLMVGCFGKSSRGLYSYNPYRSSVWQFHSDNWSSSGSPDIFEASSPYNISDDPGTSAKSPSAGDLNADWHSMTAAYPDVYVWSGPRGMLKATYNSTDAAYDFAHMGSDGGTSTDSESRPLWTGTGLDDACVFDVAETGDYLFLGVSDGGLLRADKSTWEYVDIGAYEWAPNYSGGSIDDVLEDETRAVVAYTEDDTNYTLYAANFKNADNASVLTSSDEGDTWEVIGGFGYDSSGGGNGLTSSSGDYIEVHALAVVPSSFGSSLELVAGTKDGLWGCDADASGDQWARLCDTDTLDGATGLSGDTVPRLALDETLASGWLFAAVSSNEADSLIAVDLTSSTLDCTSMNASTTYIKSATTVALAQDASANTTIIAGSKKSSYSQLYTADLNVSSLGSLTWSEAADDRDPYGTPSDVMGNALKKLDFSTIAVDPEDPTVVWAALSGQPYFDYVNPEHVYLSTDGGETFSYAEKTDYDLPNANLKVLRFSRELTSGGDTAYLYAGSCSSVFQLTL